MKKYFVVIILLNLFLFGCESITWDLSRDNPNDNLNDSNLQDGISLNVASFEIVADDNDDDFANRNETVFVLLNIQNIGTADASSVSSKVSTASTHISNLSPNINIDFGDITTGRTVAGESGLVPSNNRKFTFQFDVAETAPLNETIPFEIEIVDDANHVWNSIVDIPIVPTGANIIFSKFVVQEDNNDDDIVNINETAYLQVFLQNAGTSAANDVEAIISTNSPFVTTTFPTIAVPFNSASSVVTGITSGSERYGFAGTSPNNRNYTTRIELAPNTPADTEIAFNIDIEDGNGNTWTDQFPVIVQQTGANLEFNSYELVDEDNDDDKVNPGETVYLKVFIGNSGTSRANEVKATISSAASEISLLEPTAEVEYNNGSSTVAFISTGTERFGDYDDSPNNKAYTFQFTVDASASIGTELEFDLNIVDKEENTWTDSFSVFVE